MRLNQYGEASNEGGKLWQKYQEKIVADMLIYEGLRTK